MRSTLILALTALLQAFAGCSGEERAASIEPTTVGQETAETNPETRPDVEDAPDEQVREAEEALLREARVALAAQLDREGIDDPAVLDAIRDVPRHEFMPRELRPFAYVDRPLPIGHEQTISQPYIVALMTQLASIEPGDKVLEVGTGSGYQAAVLEEVGAELYTIEIVEPLGREAATRFERLGYDDIHTRIGDGYQGWPEAAPFDAIVITAAPPEIPQPLLDQLKVGGRMVVPVGEQNQELVVVTRTEEGYERERTIPVRFVPMTGRAQEAQAPQAPGQAAEG